MNTAEEVLDRWVTWDYELDKVADKIFFLKAMEEYASQFKASEPIPDHETIYREGWNDATKHYDNIRKIEASEPIEKDYDSELMVDEIIAICRAHSEDGCFDREGAQANALDFVNKKYNITRKTD